MLADRENAELIDILHDRAASLTYRIAAETELTRRGFKVRNQYGTLNPRADVEDQATWNTTRDAVTFYDFPEDRVGTVFDETDPTFGPIMAAIQSGDFERAAAALSELP